ncbi:MAG: tRNA uridine-5-carboxymethylaminomethyl(34) synthesis GTPase MnmE [Lachnospiraceae bacterium]|nr:tRNA uridine-5-carboxymethylaminomethyl(34) synthesis GTPase MnmE [Lachnospiraceae bacterium]
MNSQNDIIAAISTSLTPGGIGIVRVSGKGSPELCAPLVRIKGLSLEQGQANHLYYGKIYEGEELLDEALIAVMQGPRSFTAEDTVELQCHGGPLVLQRVLEAVLKAGARLAEPGEFTRRAFLNGRLDLSEAEAVMDLISAGTELAKKTALQQLQGAHSAKIRQLRSQILEKTAYLEAALDDPEHYSLDDFGELLLPELERIREEIQKLLSTSENGRRLAEGIKTVIVGRPNVGKSSLLNYWLGFERAIVTQIPGTTRDTIEESCRLGDLVLRLSDTAGIRESEEPVEKIGIQRARRAAEEADLVLLMLDSTRQVLPEEEALWEFCREKPCLVLLNKSDLPGRISPQEREEAWKTPCFAVSARTGQGLEEVTAKIREMFCLEEIRRQPVLVTNLRHREHLRRADGALSNAILTAESGVPEDFLTIDLMEAYRELGLILGEEAGEDLIREIFGKFCMGK